MGLTLDTGAVIALEDARRGRSSSRRMAFRQAIVARDVEITIPSVVVAEWWHARPGQPWSEIVEGEFTIESFDSAVAKDVGALLGKVERRDRDGRERLLLVDAAVVVGAARRRDVIYTVDGTDIVRLVALHGYDSKRVKYL